MKNEEISMNLRAVVGILCLLGPMISPVGAQGYPNKPLHFILPFPPGGPTDMLGRAIAQKLSEQMGQQVIPENRPGAGGNLGLELASKAPPDGYSITLSSPIISTAPTLYRKLNYKQSDLAALSLVAEINNVILVHPSVPAKSVKELIALMRKNPGKLNFGSGGVGTTTHLAPERIMSLTKTKMVHVPFKGSGLALIGLISGEIDVLIMAIPAAQAQVKAGKARALAILATERSPLLPDVPSAKELGIENYIVPLWYGMLAPAGTPANLITRLNAEIVKAMKSPDLRKRLESVGIEPRSSTPEEFAKFVRDQTVFFAEVIKAAGVKPN
jgi:tripartite-type tricarboxylate transporter receptor subunit TctC